MSMSKEDGWEGYVCYTCGRLLGHFHVGFGLTRIYRMLLMKYRTLWKNCPRCALVVKMRLKTRRELDSYLGMQIEVLGGLPKGTWMLSTSISENNWFQKTWEDARNEG